MNSASKRCEQIFTTVNTESWLGLSDNVPSIVSGCVKSKLMLNIRAYGVAILLVNFCVFKQHVRRPVYFHQCPVKDLFNCKFTLCSCCIDVLAYSNQPTTYKKI
ncbi:hypothetical protein TorRG33x02_237700 [Trema orientale]|uniref:Uncharacterized protein n=1 Tax=Trema orientale TaxID=63057 RepID=A0A2P5DYQ8_TREOI|nr:hypothetical protein TorRG33x02_237700 [Trema orientale]